MLAKAHWSLLSKQALNCILQTSIADPIWSRLSTTCQSQHLLNHQAVEELDHLSDVEIVCGDVKLKCHKVDLSRRSQVFMAMFQHPLKESVSNQVFITDFHPDTVESMVNFIYNGVPDEDIKYDEGLLAIADKYEIIELKKLCESALAKTLNNSNVVETWVFANKFHASYLTEEVIKYLRDNWYKKDKLENLDTVLEENPTLTKDLLYRLF